jgi:pimeloyl-ACP methyl ester carboxylesterase
VQKTVLLIHGWPQPVEDNDLIWRYFTCKGYKVYCPYLFKTGRNFSLVETRKRLIECLEGKCPDVIVGISIGGLILPGLAKDYPEAKLIFIASGVCFSPDHWLAKHGLKLCGRKIVKLVKMIDEKWLLRLYRFINPNRCWGSGVDQAKEELEDNLKKVLELSEDRIVEVLNTIRKIDNAELLAKLDNKAVIFSGDKDTMMPVEQGEKLNLLMKNSRFFILGGRHHDLIGSRMLKILGDFLEF